MFILGLIIGIGVGILAPKISKGIRRCRKRVSFSKLINTIIVDGEPENEPAVANIPSKSLPSLDFVNLEDNKTATATINYKKEVPPSPMFSKKGGGYFSTGELSQHKNQFCDYTLRVKYPDKNEREKIIEIKDIVGMDLKDAEVFLNERGLYPHPVYVGYAFNRNNTFPDNENQLSVADERAVSVWVTDPKYKSKTKTFSPYAKVKFILCFGGFDKRKTINYNDKIVFPE